MNKAILSLSILLTSGMVSAKPIVVAVIDTGIHKSLMNANFMCKSGHKDFTGKGLEDNHGHGTHIAGLIDQYAKDISLETHEIPELLSKKIDYCQVILKYFDPDMDVEKSINYELKALQYAIDIKVDIINFSGGGNEYNQKESDLVKKALDAGIKVVVAAGNEKQDIDGKVKYYPAADDPRVYVVGNLDAQGKRAPSSNYGSIVNTWERGTRMISLSTDKFFIPMTGTSQATAVKSGKIVHEMLNK